MFNSIPKNPLNSEMVSGEDILLDFYSNSQNFGKSLHERAPNAPTFTTFKPPPTDGKPSAEPTPSTQGPRNGGGIVHLGTRIITDDVPPRSYEGLKSESVISLDNVSTMPNKRPAPVVERKGQGNGKSGNDKPTNGFVDGGDQMEKITRRLKDVSNADESTYLIPRSSLIELPKTKTSPAPPPPLSSASTNPPNNSKTKKIEITAFERGKLPSIPKKDSQSQPGVIPSAPPLASLTTPEDKTSPKIPSDQLPTFKRSNFHIGLPTILPVSYKNEAPKPPSTSAANDNLSPMDRVLKAPAEFSDTNESIKTNDPPNASTHSLENPWKHGNLSSKSSTNALIRPFKLKSSDFVRTAEFGPSFDKSNVARDDRVDKKNINAIIGKKGHHLVAFDDSQKNQETKHPSKVSDNDRKTSTTQAASRGGVSKVSKQPLKAVETSDETDATTKTPAMDSKIKSSEKNSKTTVKSSRSELPRQEQENKPPKSNEEEKLLQPKRTLPRLGVKSHLEIPPNDFIKNMNFRNHLEEIIAKSASSSMKRKPVRKQTGQQPDDGQKRKFKFLVEGIDVPKGTFTENQSDSEDKEDRGNLSTKKEPKGFSYVRDKELAKQITLKAAEVTARRPHEYVENFTIEREIISNSKSIDENDVLRQARANLHAHLSGLKGRSSFSMESKAGAKEVSFVTPHDEADDVTRDGLVARGDAVDVVLDRQELGNNPESEAKTLNGDDGWSNVNHGSHNIPHDTSRIFLRPHDKDLEQLRKLQDERNKSLKRRTRATKASVVDGSLDSLASNGLTQQEASTENSRQTIVEERRTSQNDTNGGKYRQSKNGSASSVMSLKQAKIKSRAKSRPNIDPSSHPSPSPHYLLENSSQVSDGRRSVRPGESLPVAATAEQAARKTHQSADIFNGRFSDDENSVRSALAGSTSRNYKQKKVRHRRKGNLKAESKPSRERVLDLSEESDDDDDDHNDYNDSYVLYRGVGHDLRSKNRATTPTPLKRFDSEPEILDSSRFVVPEKVRVEIENYRQLASKSEDTQIRSQSNRIIAGNISVPKSLPKKLKPVSGEVTLPKKPSQERPDKVRSKTLPVKGVTVFGPGVHYKLFDNQVSKTATLPPENAIRYFDNPKSIYTSSTFGNFQSQQVNMDSKSYNPSDNIFNWSNSLARSMPSLETTLVDPELKKIDQQGTQYRVQMKLNAITPGRVSSMSGNVIESNQQGVTRQLYNRNLVDYDRRNLVSKNYEPSNYARAGSLATQVPVTSNPGNSTLSVQVTPEENILKSKVNGYLDEDSYAIKSITPTIPVKTPQPSTIEFDLELLNAGQTKLEPRSVNQSKFNNQLINDSVAQHYEPQRLENNTTRRTNHRRLQENLGPDQIDSKSYTDGIPNVIRGSILIRNSLDKNASRKYMETYNNSGSNGKQDNNLFHGKYFQNRENPIYASDLETIEHGRSIKKVIQERRSERLPEVAMDWDQTEGQKRDVPIKKEWYYDHIWNSSSPDVQSNSRRGGAWKLRSSRFKETFANRGI